MTKKSSTIPQQINTYFDGVTGIDPYVVERARSLCLGYFYYYGTPYQTLGIEVPFRLPLLSPEDGKPIEGAKPYTGIIDLLIRAGDYKYVVDRKTASRCDQTYWDALKTDAQLSHYALAMLQADVTIDGFMWDVIVKPSFSVTDLTKNNIKEIEDGMYCGLPVEKPQDVQWKDKETPYLHGLKVLAKCIDSPESVYQQRIFYRSAQDVLEYWQDMVLTEAKMRATDTEQSAMRTRSFCKSYGRLCPFVPLCCGEDPNRLGFKAKESRPTQDKSIFAGGLSVSAMNEFLGCQRKWYYSRKEGLEPVSAVPDDNTDLGTLVHSGLEIVARATMGEERIVLPTGE